MPSNSYYSKLISENPDKYPKRVGQLWTDKECITLIRSIGMKKSLTEIAKEHERTVKGITQQLKRVAVDYYEEGYKTNEIQAYTGLTVKQIENAIAKAEGFPKKPAEKQPVVHIPENSNTEILAILKNIQAMMQVLLERVQ
jgi:predicted DNA-binding protein YlxM (UPF0122 family)